MADDRISPTDSAAEPGRSGPRLFVAADLAAGAEIALAEGQAHYLRAVMRRAVGDEVRLFNGRDGEWRALLTELGKRRAAARAETRLRPQAAEPDLWLVFAPLKRTATDLIAQKATEMGASALLPVFTARTDAQRVNTDRLAAIAIEAAEQCERLSVPAVAEPRPLDALLGDWPAERRLILCDETGTAQPAAEAFGALTPGRPAALMIGPEGGFAKGELDRLRKLEFVTPVALGPRILRAETAAVAVLALWQSALGDWHGGLMR
jgi:16S rRNA (uracil1498-N3)-methyltransferase